MSNEIPFSEAYNNVGIATGITAYSYSINSLSTVYNSVSDPVATQSLTAGYITGDIWSSNYSAGVSGWKLFYNGDFEGNTGTFRGILNGAVIIGSVFETAITGARWLINSGTNNITQYWLNGSTNLAQISILDASAQYQALTFELWDTVVNNGRVMYMQRTSTGIDLYPTSGGNLGSATFAWNSLFLTNDEYFTNTSSHSNIYWKNGSTELAHIGIEDMSITGYPTLEFKLGSNGLMTIARSGIDNVEICPSYAPGSGSGLIGNSTYFWKYIYVNHLLYKDQATFDSFDDIALMKNIKSKQEDGKDVIDKTTLPKEISDGEFINANSLNGLLIGSIKALITRVETLEGQLNN